MTRPTELTAASAPTAATGLARPEGPTDHRLGLAVVHRLYVPYSRAHYAGNLVDGAYSLSLFGDVATELCMRIDGDEGLLASYSDVQFLAPVRAGDVVEASAEVIRVGRRSRELFFRAHIVCRNRPSRCVSAAEVLDPPIVATTARGVVVVPPPPTCRRARRLPARWLPWGIRLPWRR
jgi:3-aminobutyryl-CoA ammonia-lyase